MLETSIFELSTLNIFLMEAIELYVKVVNYFLLTICLEDFTSFA